MDGTLTVSNIDYVTMRQRTGIPVGDLFTVMESWVDGARIKAAMDVILELEAQACADLQPQPGLLELLGFLRASGVRLGLVTRNTTRSVDAFFGVVGEEWRAAFDIVLTRDNTPFVKPDKRSLLHFAEVRRWHGWAVECHSAHSGRLGQVVWAWAASCCSSIVPCLPPSAGVGRAALRAADGWRQPGGH
jgi:hypothetical protein